MQFGAVFRQVEQDLSCVVGVDRLSVLQLLAQTLKTVLGCDRLLFGVAHEHVHAEDLGLEAFKVEVDTLCQKLAYVVAAVFLLQKLLLGRVMLYLLLFSVR